MTVHVATPLRQRSALAWGMMRRFAVFCSLAAACLQSFASTPPEEKRVLLSLTQVKTGETADFDRSTLEALPMTEYRVALPWDPELKTYRGVLLRDLLTQRVGRTSDVRAFALNNYSAQIPREDIDHHDVLIAYAVDGKPIPVRRRGPLMVVYPMTSRPELNTATHASRCIWQIRRIEIP